MNSDEIRVVPSFLPRRFFHIKMTGQIRNSTQDVPDKNSVFFVRIQFPNACIVARKQAGETVCTKQDKNPLWTR
jgi:hypothetical protein